MTNDDSSARTWDVCVIGGGPAGLSAAITLVRRGLDVLLVERARFPRDKVCGGCMNAGALAELERLGVLDDVVRAGAVPLERFDWASEGRHVDVDLGGGLSFSRATLDELLMRRAIEEGVSVRMGTRASLGDRIDGGRMVRLTGGSDENADGGSESIVARVVVVAAGLAGQDLRGVAEKGVVSKRSHVGVGHVFDTACESFVPGTIHMAVGRDGYVGVARAEAGRTIVAAAFSPDRVADVGVDGACRALLEKNGWSLPDEEHDGRSSWQGTMRLTRRRSRPAGERLLFVGDAAGYVEPFTGEGIGWALRGGRLVADVAERAARRWDESLAFGWCATYGREVRRAQRTCRAVSTLLRFPPLVRLAMFLAGRCPGLVRPVVSRITGRTRA